MQKKILIQIFLLLAVLIILFYFYNIYFLNKKEKLNNTTINNNELDLDIKKSNILHNVEYFAEDANGGKYVIKSKFGEIQDSKPDLIFLKEVEAIITLKNSTPINIFSDGATYNSLNYNTNFYGNVLALYTEHNILSNNLVSYSTK